MPYILYGVNKNTKINAENKNMKINMLVPPMASTVYFLIYKEKVITKVAYS